MFICICVCLCVVYMFVYVCVYHVYVCMYVFMCMCAYICVYIYGYCVYVCIYDDMYIYICVCMYVYVYIYVHWLFNGAMAIKWEYVFRISLALRKALAIYFLTNFYLFSNCITTTQNLKPLKITSLGEAKNNTLNNSLHNKQKNPNILRHSF